jgi:23S rRNA (adenine2503-C2)-methyltransferase
MKKNVKGLSLPELETLMGEISEKKYRAKQIFQWIYQKNAQKFDDISNISKDLKEKLNLNFQIGALDLINSIISKDGTTKYLFELPDKSKIESVLIPPISVNKQEHWIEEREINRLTLCISTQAGCPLGCVFCATGYLKYKRNLTPFEIIDQIQQSQNYTDKRITNIVFMGMGEPLLNYENVIKSIEIINDEIGLNIAKRHITVSTAGIIPVIKTIADEDRKFKLAISMHSLDDEIRSDLMPINKKYPIKELIESIKYYYHKTKLRPTFEFILFDDINDKDRDMQKMVSLSKQIPCKFNLIHFHNSPLLETGLKPSKHFERLVRELRSREVTVMVRNSSGEDISAACGQLAGQ